MNITHDQDGFDKYYWKNKSEQQAKQIAELKELLKIANGWKEGGFDEVGFQKRIKQAIQLNKHITEEDFPNTNVIIGGTDTEPFK